MKTLICIVMVLTALPGVAQSWNMEPINLDTLTAEKRRAYLTETADSVVKRFGPGYYRKVKPHVIRRIVVEEPTDTLSSGRMRLEHEGRAYYVVDYPYDENYEFFNWGYAARVYIWADTGEVHLVSFGNGWGFFDVCDPEIYNDSTYVMPYEWKPPRKQRTGSAGSGKTD